LHNTPETKLEAPISHLRVVYSFVCLSAMHARATNDTIRRGCVKMC